MPILRLKLSKVEAQLTHLNTRAEKLGPKQYQPAADLKLKAQLPGNILDSFSESLMDQLFKQDLASPVPRESDIVYPVRYTGEMNECEVVITTGLDGSMRLQDCKVNNFDLTPLKGGYVELTWRVQAKPTPDQAGQLYGLQMQNVTIDITPPEVREPADKKSTRNTKSKTSDGAAANPGLH